MKVENELKSQKMGSQKKPEKGSGFNRARTKPEKGSGFNTLRLKP
jgi:hypothetical protein